MAYGNNQGNFVRKMYQGSWVCSKCNASISELPFEPDPARLSQLLCRDCHKNRRQSWKGGRSFGR
jgi:CxxC-x17-CxxC domain-containing protein